MNATWVPVLLFVMVGGGGILANILVGAAFLNNPSISAAKFAAWIASSLGLTLLLAVVLPSRLSPASLVVGGAIALVSLPAAFAASFYWAKRRPGRADP